jgi:hypothetical protein
MEIAFKNLLIFENLVILENILKQSVQLVECARVLTFQLKVSPLSLKKISFVQLCFSALFFQLQFSIILVKHQNLIYSFYLVVIHNYTELDLCFLSFRVLKALIAFSFKFSRFSSSSF